jgi:hypothetical protein
LISHWSDVNIPKNLRFLVVIKMNFIYPAKQIIIDVQNDCV